MDLNEIAIFVRVARTLSFSEAARQLGVPTSTISRAVARLEESLGVRLVQRSTRKLSLTAEGESYLDSVGPALQAVEQASAHLSDSRAEPSGILRITLPVDLGDSTIASICSDFVLQYPRVRVDAMVTNRTVDLIAEGVDLAIRASSNLDPSLIAKKIGGAWFGLFASPDYLNTHAALNSIEDLQNHPCVLFRAPSGKKKWTLIGPEGEISIDVIGSISSDDLAFVRAACRCGAGVALLPLGATSNDVQRGALKQVLPNYRTPGAPLYVVYPAAPHLPRKVTVFRDYAMGMLRKQFAMDELISTEGGSCKRARGGILISLDKNHV